ncbi:MAG TPA: DNA repair helicase XPB [Kofleriaceae bacterium]|nr:DNA repair helicase XPB [Kofleriaceae bacterium]
MSAEQPAIIQGDRTVLLEVDHPGYEAGRDILSRFAELERSPEHVHTYRLSALALWNAAALGVTTAEVLDGLRAISRFELPANVEHEIRELMGRHGVCRLVDGAAPGELELQVTREDVRVRLTRDPKLAALIAPRGAHFALPVAHRGALKRGLLAAGYPVDDIAGLVDGAPLDVPIKLDAFTPYPYQTAAVAAFRATGHGVIVLPCGAGKTMIGVLAMAALGVRTLVLTSSREAAAQWRRELRARTELAEDAVVVYEGARRATVAPVTITTYSMLSKKGGAGATGYNHFDRLAHEPWGLIIYDEVHLVPAPIFRLSAELQARRRLGLTATLVREDGRETDVFALIGPKRFEVSWRALEQSGHIAAATCFEVRVGMPRALTERYAAADLRDQPRIAAENPAKLAAVQALVERHMGERILIMGTYLASLRAVATALGAPVLTGDSPHREREAAYAAFRAGQTRTLVLSRVGNFAIDLPEAAVLIQISGTMGSRQEEAQRLGRVLRPKPGGASFYTIVSRRSCEEELALHRQLFLTEQGYRFFIEDMPDGPDLDSPAALGSEPNADRSANRGADDGELFN